MTKQMDVYVPTIKPSSNKYKQIRTLIREMDRMLVRSNFAAMLQWFGCLTPEEGELVKRQQRLYMGMYNAVNDLCKLYGIPLERFEKKA